MQLVKAAYIGLNENAPAPRRLIGRGIVGDVA